MPKKVDDTKKAHLENLLAQLTNAALTDYLRPKHADINRYESALEKVLDDEDKESEGMKAWKTVLDRMVFLMREADENTCTRANPYEEAYDKAQKEFNDKYGMFGEKLLTDEEQKRSESGEGTRLYMPSDVEEYKPISDQYYDEERKIAEYRRKCKEEALDLFSKWFYDLWD